MKYELLSLFCGAGGLDHGFAQAGFDTVLALDNCADAVRTFNFNAGHDVAREADLSTLTPQAFLRLVPEDSHPIGLIGGPPCQGFSRANVCADPSDPRNRLPFRFADLLAAANRKYKLHFFVFENVAGLAAPKHAERFARIRSRLRTAGFKIFFGELNASDFSVPQRRRRLFVVGFNAELYPDVQFEFPTENKAHRIVSDAIAGLPSPKFYNRKLTPGTIPFHPNHWTMVPKSAKFTSGRISDGRSFKQLRWNEVSPTVAYGNREVHVHPDGGRRLSVLEAMLLQGFSEDYTLTGSLSSQITQVSNAVPPPVAEAIARGIKSSLLRRRTNRKNARLATREISI
jgi:DNA (cytosine-5)-methyltransferase 1